MDVTVDTLRQAQDGSVEAQDKLMRFLYTPVYHFILRRTGNIDTANELTQTTFLKCYERIAHYDAQFGTVYTWVFTIARNTLIDFYRKAKSEATDDLTMVPADDIVSDTQAQASARIDGEYVVHLLQQLAEEEATVVSLRAIDEMDYFAIAKIISKSPETTRKIYSRALKKLKILATQREDRAKNKTT